MWRIFASEFRARILTRPRRPGLEQLETRLTPSVDVLTYHNDNARTGANLGETVLTPADVTSNDFGLLFVAPVNGKVDAQPLYMSGVTIPGKGVHNVLLVATEHDSVYAFDADNNTGADAQPLWSVSFINPTVGVTTAPAADVHCDQVAPELGITATPVIDSSNGTVYVVAMTKEVAGPVTNYVQRIHALDISTGAEKFGGPVAIQASVPGTGDGSTIVTFNPRDYKERPGLLLLNGVVYTTWSSHCDIATYHGWVIGYDAATLQQVSVLNVTPDGNGASLWASGAAPAADANGNIYFLTGNGTFDANSGGRDYGDSLLKVSTASGLSVADYFTPHNQQTLANQDLDLGSGGAMLLPGSVGSAAHPNLLIGAGKEGTIYVVDPNNPGRFNPTTDQVVQELPSAIGPEFGAPAYFNGVVYFGGVGDALKAFQVANGLLSTSPISQTVHAFGYPGTTASISANGTTNGIVWAAENGLTAALHAFDAANLARELYNSNMVGTRDHFGTGNKFITPTVANGKVYVGTTNGIGVFGLLPSTPVGSEAFVRNLYVTFLGRTGSRLEWDGWASVLPSLGAAGVATRIEHSPEALTHLVDSFYSRFLGRTSSAAEDGFWVDRLNHGATAEQVIDGFLASGEFATHANTLIGSADADNNFIRALYSLVLDRTNATTSSSEVDSWRGLFTPADRSSVVAGFLDSAEFRSGAVRTFYGDTSLNVFPYQPFFPNILHRSAAPSGGESNGWVGSHLDFLGIEQSFAITTEFMGLP